MKRTTPSEIRMLDVTSSEKFTWPLRETRGLTSLSVMLHQNRHSGIKALSRHNTWCVHDVEKVRFASGVWQDHCDRGTLDTNSPLEKKKTDYVNLTYFLD